MKGTVSHRDHIVSADPGHDGISCKEALAMEHDDRVDSIVASPLDTPISRRRLVRFGGAGALGMLLGPVGSASARIGSAAAPLAPPPKKPPHLIVRTWGDPWKST